MKRTIFWALLLIAAGCSSPKNTRTADPLRVTTIVAAPSAGFGAAVYVGSVEEEASASLSFPVAGTVARTLADEGQRVRKGQLLAELDSTSARQTFDAARASLEQAEDACGRLRQLYEAQSLPEIKWVEAQTRLRQAESLFEIAKKNLSDCALYAPFDGVVGERRASAGETVLPGVPVMKLLQIGTVKVRFSVPEQEIAAIGADSRMRITVPALGDRTFQAGKVEKGAVANPAAHTYDVRAALANAGGELLPGMVCRVEVSPAGAAEQIALPVRAVQQAGDGSRFVWTVRGDSAVRTAVTTGRLVNNAVVLEDGVRSGDRIVVDGMQKIGEGSKVVWCWDALSISYRGRCATSASPSCSWAACSFSASTDWFTSPSRSFPNIRSVRASWWASIRAPRAKRSKNSWPSRSNSS